MNQKVYICRGLPGSGKTTWSKQKQNEDTRNVHSAHGKERFIPTKRVCLTIRVNNDDIREELGIVKWNPKLEKQVKEIFYQRLNQNLALGRNVICDNTYLNPSTLSKLQNWLIEHYPNVVQEIVDFTHVHPNECIDRDKQRARNGDRHVGWEVIWQMYCDYLLPKPIVYSTSSKPSIIICDLDGTLCDLNGRNPYDASTCDKDLPNIAVLDILKTYSSDDVGIIFVSGRNEKWKDKTETFLYNVCNYYIKTVRGHAASTFMPILFMRKNDDTRKDWIVKKEIYDTHIKPNYNVLFAIDDRNQVLRMWRVEGISTLCVGPGYEF